MSTLHWAPLQDLSLIRLHHGRVPRVPTNAERMAAYRPFLPVQFANAHDWPFDRAARYAAEQMADHPESFPSYADRRGF